MENQSSDSPDPPPTPTASTGNPPLELVEGLVERPRLSLLHRFSLIVVSIVLLLLPVAYLGLAALAGCGLYAYAVDFRQMLDGPGVGGAMTALFAYLVPLFVGAIFLLLLIKPIFAPRHEEEEPCSLKHNDAPQLFALIGWICRSLDAPFPSRVDVDCRVNISVRFRDGLRSMLRNDLVVVVGLPLVAGLNLGQFAGFLAHECGHFSQGAPMRARYVIRLINNWFSRVVYERDAWDVALVAVSEREDHSLVLVLPAMLAQLSIWLCRRVLWVLMALSHALSCALSREMEFDADRLELKISGSETFATSLRRARQLDFGSELAARQIINKWVKERKLFDRIPDFIVSRAAEIPAETQDTLYAAQAKARARVFDVHPSDAERLRHAAQANEPGLVHSTAPARSLFANYPELSRRATLAYYQSAFGPNVPDDLLVSTETSARQAEHDWSADRDRVRRYFLGIATNSRPLIVAENQSFQVRSHETLCADIANRRRRMNELLPSAQAALTEFDQADARLLLAWQAAHLAEAGFQFNDADFGLSNVDPEQARTEALRSLHAAGEILQTFEQTAQARLADNLQLLRLPNAAAAASNSVRLMDEARQMIWVLSRLGEIFEPLLELRQDCAALEIILRYRRDQPLAENLMPTLENLCTGIQERVNQLQQQTGQIRYPFQHATEQIFVSDYARNTEHHADPHELTLREGRSHVEKLAALHDRLVARLIGICEEVERQVGL